LGRSINASEKTPILLIFLKENCPFLGQRSKRSRSGYPRFCEIIFSEEDWERRTETDNETILESWNTRATGWVGESKKARKIINPPDRNGKLSRIIVTSSR